MDILDKINNYLGEEVKKYKPRKVKHGTKKSKASKLTGAAKFKYIKDLKDRKMSYKHDATAKKKAKKASKKYRKSNQGKVTAKKYDLHH